MQQICSFQVDTLTLGVPALRVQEIIRAQPTTRVPLADRAVAGLINLRGQIVTAIDTRRCLALPEARTDRPPMNLVVRTPDGVFSLLVDEIGDVLDIADDAVIPPPDTIAPAVRPLFAGAIRLDQRLLLIVETDHVIRASGAGEL